MAERPTLVLASGSPRRRDLLAGLGLEFAVRPVDVDETPLPDEPPRAYVERLAREKAAARVEAGELVLAADTTVVLDGEILGKPEDEAGAREMLSRLAGREHTVFTGIALVARAGAGTGGAERAPAAGPAGGTAGGNGGPRSHVEESRVRIAAMSPDELAWYAATGEGLDKAGSYAVQGLGALFVERICGDYTNVVGLPLPATFRLFRRAGHDLRSFRP
ncbi:MAG: Maf family protein [Thermoanaerobaculia bacterium]